MKHISIVATKPGCGKTFVLTNLFNKSNLPNKVILAPTNKAKQEIIKRLTSEDASRVFTMDKFKQNYIELQHKEGSKLYKDYYPRQSEYHDYKKAYNVFIDEYSMFSKAEIDDLVEHFPIMNIITAGDINQFQPIPEDYVTMNADSSIVYSNDNMPLAFHDDGSVSDLPISKQIILTKSYRFTDTKLIELTQAIKDANVQKIILLISKSLISEASAKKELKTSMNIPFTKEKCIVLNSLVDAEDRLIVQKNDFQHEFYKGEIYTAKDLEVSLRKIKHCMIFEDNKTEHDFEVWKKAIFKKAYAVNAHKLQGSTINMPVIVYFDDLIKSRDTIPVQNALRFLYVAVTRATHFDKLSFAANEYELSILEEILSHAKPMKDDFLKDAIYCDSSNVDYDAILAELDDDLSEEALEHYKSNWLARCKNKVERSDKGKEHKEHKKHERHKPLKQYPQEWIELAKTVSFAKWKETTGAKLSKTTFTKMRKGEL